MQVLRLPKAFKLIFAEDKGEGDISSFAALATALAATVGTGNIVGVATAIKTGGPGALFWMWIAAFFGMATKYSEGLLAIKFRTLDDQGNVSGGPMYYITHGFLENGKQLLNLWPTSLPLQVSLLHGWGLVPSLKLTQSPLHFKIALTGHQNRKYPTCPYHCCYHFGGINLSLKFLKKVVPFMAGLYILAALVVIFTNFNQLLPVLETVFQSAFTGKAAVGGFAGATVMVAMRLGIARGVFSNESGLGSAPIAAAAAKTEEPVEQGLISMTGTFIDTIIICTLTGLAILVTGQWSGSLEGAPMTQAAFSSVFGTFGEIALTLSLVLFAFTTILGWSYYGERCFEFIFKSTKFLPLYRLIFVVMVALGGFTSHLMLFGKLRIS